MSYNSCKKGWPIRSPKPKSITQEVSKRIPASQKIRGGKKGYRNGFFDVCKRSFRDIEQYLKEPFLSLGTLSSKFPLLENAYS